MKYIFGKSEAAILLEKLVQDDEYLCAKVSSHISDYNRYVKNVMTMRCPKAKMIALSTYKDCDLSVPIIVKQLILNIKTATRRDAIAKINN